MSDKVAVAEKPSTVKLYIIGNFPYVSPEDYGTKPVAEISAERFEELRVKVQELNTKYALYKSGAGVPGMEALKDEASKVAELKMAADAAMQTYYEARAEFKEKQSVILKEVAAESGKREYDLMEESKRTGQRIVCAEMAEAFPEIFSAHPKYQNVAAGKPREAIDNKYFEDGSDKGGDDPDADPDGGDEEKKGED